MQFTTGALIRASRFRDAIGNTAVLESDVSTISNATTYIDAAGLAVPLDAGATYIVEGYLAYVTSAAASVAITFSTPPDTVGTWHLHGLEQAAGAVSGNLENIRRTFTPGTAFSIQGAAGSGTSMMCIPTGFLYTARFSGQLQAQFAQIVSTASATTIKAGSWLRATRVSG